MTCKTKGCIDGKIMGFNEVYACPECSQSLEKIFQAKSVKMYIYRLGCIEERQPSSLQEIQQIGPWKMDSWSGTSGVNASYLFVAPPVRYQLSIYLSTIPIPDILKMVNP